MREILFRGKCRVTNEWVEGGYAEISPPPQVLDENTDSVKYCIVVEKGFADWGMPRQYAMREVHPETIGQYTGFKDIDDVKIFEGDIVQYCKDYYPCDCQGVKPQTVIVPEDGSCQSHKTACQYQEFDGNPDGTINFVSCIKKMEKPPQNWHYVWN